MTLKEVGIIIGKKLKTRYRPIADSPIIISFDSTEVREGIALLVGAYGKGMTVAEAKKDYCKRISGQYLIIDAMLSARRKEIQLPPKITVK